MIYSEKAIAVLGGGLTGLSSAFHLARRFPQARIIVLERQTRLGGWVCSERVPVRVQKTDQVDGEDEVGILLEAGPRTLRPNGLAVLELVNLLSLQSDVITVPRTAPAAQNRFLCLPGHSGLLSIPNSLTSMLTSPLAPMMLRAVFSDITSVSKPASVPDDELYDKSVDAFLSRQFGSSFARTFGSALVHGIYAADSRQLSTRTAFPILLDLAAVGKGSVLRGVLKRATGWGTCTSESRSGGAKYNLGDVPGQMKGVSVFAFKDGMETLVRALYRALRRSENVEIHTGRAVTELKQDGDCDLELRTADGHVVNATHVVSAVPLQAFNALVNNSPHPSSQQPFLHLTANPSSSVTVVNLVFPSPPDRAPIHPAGFGYLIPRPEGGYPNETGIKDANRLGILGTVFDSCALAPQDIATNGIPAPVAKLTVMLGGPYLGTSTHSPSASPAFVPDLIRELSRHISPGGVPLPDPLLVRVHHHVRCIPTPTVGHEARMAKMKKAVHARWAGRVEVVGAEVGGVSVNACVEMGRGVGLDW